MIHRILIILILTLVSGCGFHLKGDSKLPLQLQVLHVIKSDDSDFNATLLQQLKSSGVIIVDDVKAALLSVQFQTLPEITVAKSSSSGLLIKQLKVRIEYSVKNKAGDWLIKQKQLEQTKDFESNTNQLLAKNNEKQQMYRQMKQSLVRILLYQLQVL